MNKAVEPMLARRALAAAVAIFRRAQAPATRSLITHQELAQQVERDLLLRHSQIGAVEAATAQVRKSQAMEAETGHIIPGMQRKWIKRRGGGWGWESVGVGEL